MHRSAWGVVVSCLILGSSAAHAEDAAPAQPAVDPALEAMMAAAKLAGSPGEGHKALEPFVGTWTYTMEWRLSPDAPPQQMSGKSVNTLVFDGRFLKQEVQGDATPDFPAFGGLGFTGYDNIRKEYQSVWLDNMGTGLMMSTGQRDPATGTIAEQGDFSCPMTGEAHRKFRAVWKAVDPQHNIYESYSYAPDGREFKSMEIRYTRAQ